MKRFLLSGALSCLIIGAVFRCPCRNHRQKRYSSRRFGDKDRYCEAENRFDTGFWIGLGAVALGGVVAWLLSKRKRMMKRNDETSLCLCRARRKEN